MAKTWGAFVRIRLRCGGKISGAAASLRTRAMRIYGGQVSRTASLEDSPSASTPK